MNKRKGKDMKRRILIVFVLIAVAVFAASFVACERADVPSASDDNGGESAEIINIYFYSDGVLYGISVCAEGTLALPKDPQKNGCSFAGWFYDEEGTIPFVLDEYLGSDKDGDLTLYAAWNETGDPSGDGEGGEEIPPDDEEGNGGQVLPDEGDGNGDAGDGEEGGEEEGDGEDDPKPPVPEEKTYTVTFVMNGEVIGTQKVKEGGSAILPLDRFFVADGVLYSLIADGNYTDVVKDETVVLVREEADEEEKGLYALGYLTLLIKDSKLYVDSVSSAYPLDYIVLPSSWGYFAINGIKDGAFARVPHLKSVNVGAYCTEIEWSAFDDLPLLEEVGFSADNDRYSARGLFVLDKDGDELIKYVGGETELLVGGGITAIAAGAFEGENIISVTLPEGVVSLGERAFADCLSLTSLTLPDSLAVIGKSAFENCSALEKIRLPAGVKTIGDRAFAECGSLSTVNYDAVNADALVQGNAAFSGTGGEKGFAVIVGENVVSIPARLFDARGVGAPLLTSLTFADNGALTSIGSHAFAATDIQTLVIPASVTRLASGAFSGCEKLMRVEYRAANEIPPVAEATAFGGAGAEGSVFVIGKEVKSVPDYLIFSLSDKVNFTRLEFEAESVLESIGALAFAGSSVAGETVLPASVGKIGDGAFAYCDALTYISVEEGGATYLSEDGVLYGVDGTLVAYPAGRGDESYTVKDGTSDIKAYAFAGAVYLADVEFSCTRVGDMAFNGCDSLRGAILSEGVEEIGTGAFSYCSLLGAAVMPSTLRKIGENAYINCTSLAVVTLNEGLLSIGSRAFAYCPALGETDLPSTVTDIGEDVFAK